MQCWSSAVGVLAIVAGSGVVAYQLAGVALSHISPALACLLLLAELGVWFPGPRCSCLRVACVVQIVEIVMEANMEVVCV